MAHLHEGHQVFQVVNHLGDCQVLQHVLAYPYHLPHLMVMADIVVVVEVVVVIK